MFQHSLRSLGLPVALGGLLAHPLSTAAAEDSLGFLDLRLGVGTLPTQNFRGGPSDNRFTGEFDSAYRVSLMVIGPICGFLPMGCSYQPFRDQAASTTHYDPGLYDDLVIERSFMHQDAGRPSFDLLLGLELSFHLYEHDGSPARNIPNLDMNTGALTVHAGFGISGRPSSVGVLHAELTGFAGVGLSQLEWTDYLNQATPRSDKTTALYTEFGGRIGIYYTFRAGFQLGIDARLLAAQHNNEVFRQDARFRLEGGSLGAQLGWRF